MSDLNNKNSKSKPLSDFNDLHVHMGLGTVKQQLHDVINQSPTPVYRLKSFKPLTHKTTVICEGQKAADAAINLFPNYFVTCRPNNPNSTNKTDYTILKDQAVIFWPNNDKAGTDAVSIIDKELSKVGIKSLSVVNCKFFEEFKPSNNGNYITGGKWPKKANACDAVSMGWTTEHIQKAIDNDVLFDKNVITPATDEDIIPFGYKLNESGIWHFDPKKEGYRKLCSPIEIISLSRSGNGDGRNWGRLVKFKDFDNQEKLWNIPMQSFATEAGAEIIRGLLDRGLNISSYREAKRKILEYLQEYETNKRVALVYKTGWYKDSFVFPESVIGGTEKAMYYSESPPMCKLGTNGTLEQWKSKVSFYCKNNPLALFSISAALSAPIVELMGYESMGFHFYGDSSWGKSTLLNVACSVYGDPEKYKCTFRTTDNALESLASSHSDMLLALDEINQVDSRIIGDIIYMLGNGQGKHRANDRGQAKESQHRWKLTYLTNGEKTLEQYLSEAGKKLTGGMEMRFLGIQATFHEKEAERKHKGVFNYCHDFAGGAELSNQLKRNMQKYYGTAFPSFIELLVKQDIKELTAWLCKEVDKFITQNISNDAGGQVQRAAAKFALVGLSGELATKWGITGWEKGEAINSARECLNSWLKNRGGQGNMENKQLIADLKLQLEMYGDSKFKRWDKNTKSLAEQTSTIVDTHVPSPSEMWGFRQHVDKKCALDGDTQEVIYYIFPNAFEKVICKNNDHIRLARLLRDIGALILRDSEIKENRVKTKERLPGSGKTFRPIYKVKASVLFDEQ